MEQGPKFQGTLEKQGRMKTWTWKKYWFVLKENDLVYVKSQDKNASQGNINLSQAQSVRVVTGNHGYPFEIVTKSRTHHLSASTDDIRNKWVAVLHEAMAWHSRRNSRSLSSSSSMRASCNSIGDDEDGYSSVQSLSPAGSPSYSSGYSSSGRTSDVFSRDSDLMYSNPNYSKFQGDGDEVKSKDTKSICRDSDLVYMNPNYSKFQGDADKATHESQHTQEDPEDLYSQPDFEKKSEASKKSSSRESDLMYMNPNYTNFEGEIQETSPPKDSASRDSSLMYTNANYSQFKGTSTTASDTVSKIETGANELYEEVGVDDAKRSSKHEGLRRLHPSTKKPAILPKPVSIRASNMSDMSDIYDEVREPTATANLAISHIVEGYVNIARNKGPQPPEEDNPDEYDDVFTSPSDRESRASTVIMRKSGVVSQRISDVSFADQPSAAPDSRDQRSSNSRMASTTRIRRSMLPSDLSDYFNYKPIPELQNPRLELTWRTAFDDIRQFLANNRSPNECYPSVQKKDGQKKETHGEAISSLQDFLAVQGN